jgi:hypothetical protein
MAFFIVRYNDGHWINPELAKKVFAKGEHSFVRAVATQEVAGEPVLDQILFPITEEQREDVMARFSPNCQDFDGQYRKLHVLAQDGGLTDAQAETCCPGVVVTRPGVARECLLRHRFTDFLPYRMCHSAEVARLFDRGGMALVRLCKYVYVAVNAVDVTVERPVIVSL